MNFDFRNLPVKFYNGGIRYVYIASNGYKASIVQSPMSYGGNVGLYELAVMDQEENILYDTPITNDVLGWLTVKEVNTVIAEIEKLPKREEKSEELLVTIEEASEIVLKTVCNKNTKRYSINDALTELHNAIEYLRSSSDERDPYMRSK